MSKAQLELPISFEAGSGVAHAGTTVDQPHASHRQVKASSQTEPQPSSASSVAREFLKSAQVCARYKVSRQTIWRWIKIGNFPAPHQLSSRAVRWAVDELEAYEEELKSSKRSGKRK